MLGERAVAVDLPANITHHMKKQPVQEGASQIEAQEQRKLNMEEKRKVEKLLLSDIDSTVARYNAQAEEVRGNLIDKLTKNPPADVKSCSTVTWTRGNRRN
jgi:hypothetical protein